MNIYTIISSYNNFTNIINQLFVTNEKEVKAFYTQCNIL